MGKSQRTKGASYEREICAVFSKALGATFKRHIGQARDGGNDITVGPLVVECKRRKSLKTIEGWLAQARRAAGNLGDFPVVVMRSDGGISMVLLDLDDFIALAGDGLRMRMLGPDPRHAPQADGYSPDLENAGTEGEDL